MWGETPFISAPSAADKAFFCLPPNAYLCFRVSLSVLDGWWIERHLEGVTGWSIGDRVEACLEPQPGMDTCHSAELYRKLEEKVLPCFYKDRERFIEIMRHTIALNGAFFNTQRMVAQYLHDAYRLGQAPVQQSPGST